jgi:hypothetical protein
MEVIMANVNNKRNDRVAADQKLIDGTQKLLTQFATLPVGGKNLTPADIVKVLQDRIGKATAAQTAEAARATAVKEDRDERANTAPFVVALRRIALGMFQANPDTLAIFGLKAPKARKTKVATKAAAIAKNKATRTARGTKGPKAKLKVKGTAPAQPGGGTAPEPAATPTAPAAPTVATTPTAATPPAATTTPRV